MMSEGPIDILCKMARNQAQDARVRSDLDSTNLASDLEIAGATCKV